eukprot:TRINITY_DN4504_c4_g1_i1.p1 TRINITY_DN4504_c4_g1~~TRINITY_DN4504_c4_g1_i1.p1  ORF type:complete len:1161 (+),score=250.80 TRINITY_DN4504_c4_g1_i1:63-3485(+)
MYRVLLTTVWASAVSVQGQDAQPICGVDFAESGSKELNIQDIRSDLELFCDGVTDFNNNIHDKDVRVRFSTDDDVKGEALTLSEVKFDLYAEMLASESTTIELPKLDTQWVEGVKEHLVDLSDPSLNINVDNIFDIWRKKDMEGRLVGIPIQPNRITMYYRKDLFDKYGHTWNHDSWEVFETTLLDIQTKERADRLSKGLDDDFWGFTIPTDDSTNRMMYMLVSLLSGHDGGGVVEDDGTVSINNPNAVKTIARWASWFSPASQYNIVSPECFGQSTSGATNFFTAGKSAAIIVWTSGHSQKMNNKMKEDPSFVIRTAPIPGSNAAGCSGDWSLAVSRYAREKEEAYNWVRMLVSNSMNMSNGGRIEPIDKRVREDPTMWAKYCELNPVLCIGFEEYPTWWSKLSHRPARGCGTLYSSCANAVYQHMYSVFQHGVDPAAAAASIERDLNIVLGHWEPSSLTSSKSSWETTERITLVVVAGVGFVLLSVMFIYNAHRSRYMRRPSNFSAPVCVVFAIFLSAALAGVMSAVIADSHNTSKSLSDKLAEQIRMQSLRSVQYSIQGTIDSLVGSTSRKAISDLAVAKMKSDFGKMGLDPRTIVLLIDRNYPFNILVSSDKRRQPERISVVVENGTYSHLYPWTAELLTAIPSWQTQVIDGMHLENNGVHSNLLSVDYSSSQGSRDISYLLCYMTPAAVIQEEADESMERSLNFAITLSIVTVILVVGMTIVFTAPLINLATDMEYVRLFEMEKVSSISASKFSFMTEIASMLLGFEHMCEMLTEYKAYLPKTVFADSDTDIEESVVNGRGGASSHILTTRSSRSQRSETSVSQNTTTNNHGAINGRQNARNGVEIGKLRTARGACLIFQLKNGNSSLARSEQPHEVVKTLLSIMEEAATRQKGVLHTLSARSPTEFMISWGIIGPDVSCCYKAARTAIRLRDAIGVSNLQLPEMTSASKAQFSISLSGSRCKAGNMGTTYTRAFGMTGEMCDSLSVLKAVGDDFASISNVILIDQQGAESLHDFDMRAVEIIKVGQSVVLVKQLLSESTAREAGEWMYQIQTAPSRTTPLDKCFQDLLAGAEIGDVVEQLANDLSEGSQHDDLLLRIAERLTHRSKRAALFQSYQIGVGPHLLESTIGEQLLVP